MARILAIDDEQRIRRLLQSLLSAEGHDVQVAASVSEAQRHLADGPVDLVISDLMMPEKDGLELLLELRRDRPDLRVIAISGGGANAWTDVLEVARKLGAFRTLAKPFDLQAMIDTVHEALSTRE